jgi:signal transduction histidine kinase
MTLAYPQQPQDTSIRDSQFVDGPEKHREANARHLAHDVRNWLTVLQVYCDLLRTSATVAGDVRKWIEELSCAVERGQGLVTSLLDSAQVSEPLRRVSSAAGVSPKLLDLAAAIERRLPLLREMAGSPIQVEVETVDHAGTTALREPEFERILLNLVRNAIDAMPHGGTLKIALEHGDSSQRSSLVLRVSDTGNGIATEFLPHIFDSGFSTKLTPADPLMERGFGLAIVRELTLGAGGSVRVHSCMGHGSSFAVELPLLSDSLPPDVSDHVSAKRKLAVVSEMPRQKRGRHAPRNNSGANRKGTRVPC